MSCPKLFGAPNNNTGLTEAECAPAFDGFAPPTYDEAFLEALGAAELVDAPAAPAADPYAEAWTTYVAGVCAVAGRPCRLHSRAGPRRARPRLLARAPDGYDGGACGFFVWKNNYRPADDAGRWNIRVVAAASPRPARCIFTS